MTLDDLKMVNDTYGHSCGDEIIIAAGKRIVAEAGENAFVSRGGRRRVYCDTAWCNPAAANRKKSLTGCWLSWARDTKFSEHTSI